MTDSGKPTGYVPIHYDEIIQQDGYVTGIAHVTSPGGTGEFEIRVSGQRQAILDYQEKGVIVKLEVVLIVDAIQTSQMAQQRVLAARRQEWLNRLEQIRTFINTASLADLNDPNVICRSGLAQDKIEECKNPEEDLAQDRLIEIKPLNPINPDGFYLLSFTVHPDLPRGKKDIYRPVVQGSYSASASITNSLGDADLQLYRGGAFRDGSYSAGVTNSVYAEGGTGGWKLHVIGYTDATYEISGDWVLRRNNV